MVSTPGPTVREFTRSPPGSPSRDISPVSPKSWEDSLLELDSDLQRICGPSRSPLSTSGSPGILIKHGASPPTGHHHHHHHQLLSHSYPATSLLLPPPDRCTSPHASPCRRSTSQESALRASAPSVIRTSSSPPPPPSPSSSPSRRHHHHQRPEHLRSQSCVDEAEGAPRPLIVRHEETSERLAEKLSRICGAGQPLEGASPKHARPLPRDIMALSSSAVRRDSLKSAFRHDVQLSGLPLVDVAACVTGEHRLRVLHVTRSESRPIDDVALPPAVEIHRVMCRVDGDRMAVRERSKPLWSCESAGSGPRYVPVIQQDDATRQLRVVLHIPDELRYEDLSVRTVDDHLIISRKRLSYPGASALQFEVGLVLPDMGDSRGVDASLTHSNQLYIVVTFDGGRPTCC